MDRRKLAIEDGEVTINGKLPTGQGITLTGAVKNIEVEEDRDLEEQGFGVFDLLTTVQSTNMWLKLEQHPLEGHLYKLQLHGFDVERQVTLAVNNFGDAAREEVRQRAKAPVDAKHKNLVRNHGQEKLVKFYWTETVYD